MHKVRIAMVTKTKAFDGVEMKNRIQARRMAEYESRKDEFPSFLDFVRAKANESEWVRQVRKKFSK
jgi:hypothetical protein